LASLVVPSKGMRGSSAVSITVEFPLPDNMGVSWSSEGGFLAEDLAVVLGPRWRSILVEISRNTGVGGFVDRTQGYFRR
jgi:Flp pilus assembly protein CpaB